MSIVISNVSTHDDLAGLNTYIVHLAGKPVIARFDHVRSEGLATCLRRAADAVDDEQSVTSDVIAPSPESTDLQEHHGNVQKLAHSGDGLRPDRPVLPLGGEKRPAARPVAAGFYWARQIAVDPGTRDEDEFEPSSKFEPVEVFENTLDKTHPEYLRVSALGIERGQSLDNFEWGAQIPVTRYG